MAAVPIVTDQPDIVSVQKILDAIAQRVVERDLGYCRIDRDLHRRPVDLAQRLLNDVLRLLG